MTRSKMRLMTVLFVISLLLLAGIAYLATPSYNPSIKEYVVSLYHDNQLITTITKAKHEVISDSELDDIKYNIKDLDYKYSYVWSLDKQEIIPFDLMTINNDTNIYLLKEPLESKIEFVETGEFNYFIDIKEDSKSKEAYAVINIVANKDLSKYKMVVTSSNGKIVEIDNRTYRMPLQDEHIKIEVKFYEIVETTLNNQTYVFDNLSKELTIGINHPNIVIPKEDFILKYYEDEAHLIETIPINVGTYYGVLHYIGKDYYIEDTTGILTIEKASPFIVTLPIPDNMYMGLKTSEINLISGKANVTGRFEWVDDSYIEEGRNSYYVKFIPNDNNYKEIIFTALYETINDEEALRRIALDRKDLINKYQNILINNLQDLPTLDLIASRYKSKIDWLASSTGIMIDKFGNLQILPETLESVVTLYAVITLGDYAEYARFDFEVNIVENLNDVLEEEDQNELNSSEEVIPIEIITLADVNKQVTNTSNMGLVIEHLKPDLDIDDIIKSHVLNRSVIKEIVNISEKHSKIISTEIKLKPRLPISEIILWQIILNEDKNDIFYLSNKTQINKIFSNSLKGENK